MEDYLTYKYREDENEREWKGKRPKYVGVVMGFVYQMCFSGFLLYDMWKQSRRVKKSTYMQSIESTSHQKSTLTFNTSEIE
jgi:hypothetical protein